VAGGAGTMVQSGLGFWLAAYMKSFSGPPGSGKLQAVPRIVPLSK